LDFTFRNLVVINSGVNIKMIPFVNFIYKLIQKKAGLMLKVNLSNLSIPEQEKAKFILKNGKFIEKRTSYGQTLALYLVDKTYFELLYETQDQVISKVMEITDVNMKRFYGKE